MTNIILNEKAFAENAISNLTLGAKPGETLNRVAKYYYNEGYKKKEVGRLLEDFLLKCDPSINITKWQATIDRVANTSDKYKLINIDGVSITKSELTKIEKIQGKLLKKLAFTMLCLAKYRNAINPNNNNWVNEKDRDIFSLANITVTTKRQSLMINDLWSQGYIGYSRVVDNININVKFIDEGSPSRLFITDFRNLGNQYLKYMGENYIECQNCGIVVKRESNGKKYCHSCADEIIKQKKREWKRSSLVQ